MGTKTLSLEIGVGCALSSSELRSPLARVRKLAEEPGEEKCRKGKKKEKTGKFGGGIMNGRGSARIRPLEKDADNDGFRLDDRKVGRYSNNTGYNGKCVSLDGGRDGTTETSLQCGF